MNPAPSRKRGDFDFNPRTEEQPMIDIRSFELDTSILPDSIYGEAPYRYQPTGVVLDACVREELSALLAAYLRTCGCAAHGTYFRIDAYFDLEKGYLWILEINALFVDGWGTALNLSRAAGYPVRVRPRSFPSTWTTEDPAYLPELRLACEELRLATGERFEVTETPEKHAYRYGRSRSHATDMLDVLEDKLALTTFSREWCGTRVHVPKGYSAMEHRFDELSSLRGGLVFKHRFKRNNREVVCFSDQAGKGVRRAYGEKLMIAQEVVQPWKLNGRPTQLVLLAVGSEPVTGYLLCGELDERILTDRGIHGPLIFV